MAFFELLFSWLPDVSVASIPVIGPSLAEYLLLAVTKWNAFMVTFPYAEVVWNVFLFAIIPFELLLLVLKVILAHRVPVSSNTN